MAPVHLSVCMIVRNEADRLPTCLRSVLPIADELIVVDTGSTDDTIAVARSLGAEVFEFLWCDDFAAARNEALRHATGDWVLVLDADEILVEGDGLIHQIASQPIDGPRAYALTIHNHLAPSQTGTIRHLAPRLHARHPDFCWQGRIHEQLVDVAAGSKEVTAEWLPGVTIEHMGYLPDVVAAGAKRARNRRLFELELQERPDRALLHFQMGIFLVQDGHLQRALRHLHQSLRLAEGEAEWPSFGTTAVLQGIGIESMLGHHRAALELARRFEWQAESHPGYWINRGIAAMQMGEWDQARAAWQASLAHFSTQQPQVVWDDQALLTLPLLQADAASRQGDLDEAASWLAGVLRVQPEFAAQAAAWSLWLAGEGRRDLAIGLLQQAGAGDDRASAAGHLLALLETGAALPDGWAAQARPPRLVAPVPEKARLGTVILATADAEALLTTLSGVDGLADEILVVTTDEAQARVAKVFGAEAVSAVGDPVGQLRQTMASLESDWLLVLQAGEALDEAAGGALKAGIAASGGRQFVWGDALREALPAAEATKLVAVWEALGQREPIAVVWG